jgi:hypothetical protein
MKTKDYNMSKLNINLINGMKKAGYDVKLISDKTRFYLWVGNEIVLLRDKK